MFTSNKKDKLIQLRVTQAQKDAIKRLADKNKMSITDYIFSLLEKDFKTQED